MNCLLYSNVTETPHDLIIFACEWHPIIIYKMKQYFALFNLIQCRNFGQSDQMSQMGCIITSSPTTTLEMERQVESLLHCIVGYISAY